MSLAVSLDEDFERRWAAWTARGLAHERMVRDRFATVAGVAVILALGAILVSGLIAP